MKYELYGKIAPDRKTGKKLGWSVQADSPDDAVEAAKIHREHVRRTRAVYTDYGKRIDRIEYLMDEEGKKFDLDRYG